MKDRDSERKPTLYEMLHRAMAHHAAFPRPNRKPPRRGKSGGGSEPVPADPKPRPTLLTGGAEVPLDEG